MAEEINLPIDISSLIWMVVAAFFYGGMKLYVVYKTSIIPTSRTETLSTFISLFFLEVRKSIADTLPVVKDYKKGGVPLTPEMIQATKDVTKLVADMDLIKGDVSKLKNNGETPPVV